MCGIVGYTGKRKAVPILLDGLYKLEYRGYDSAGVAYFEKGAMHVIKTKGRIHDLQEKIEKAGKIDAACGIGHTRWATHGEPSDLNSHPHLSMSGKIAVIHNGIIENYLELKDMLSRHGYVFRSQTDTEVIAHLVEYFYCGDLVKAVLEAISRLRGSYALGVITTDRPEEIVAARQDGPLIVGVGEKENMIASDIPAIIACTRRFIVLNDHEVAIVRPDGVRVINSYGETVEKQIQTVTWDISAAQKCGYEHFMIKEIMEQPKAVRDTLSPRIKDGLPDLAETGLNEKFFSSVKKINIVACGSALHAGMVGGAVIERLSGIPVFCEVASEFRYRDPIITKDDLAIIISQSGETADTLAALREAKGKGAKSLSVVNVVSSSIARESDAVLYTWAGPEIAVATTKAYSAQLAALYLIAIHAGISTGKLSEAAAKRYTDELSHLPVLIEKTLELREKMQYLASQYHNRDDIFFIGRGFDYSAVQEASLKLKEISYVHSEAYAAGELKHGTISLIEQGTLVVAIATESRLFEKMLSNIREVKARGAHVLLLSGSGFNAGNAADTTVMLPECIPEFSSSLSVVPMQLFAYYVGVYRGCDVDKPRNLAKSVTVE